MSIDFSTLQGLTIPEGVVTEIKDAGGRVIWAVSGGKVILQVEKMTYDTKAGETIYTGEQFILLDIYPTTNGTVTVTYGGLTKTITDTSGVADPNAQQVFFGTFYGVSDSVTTPASGELTIEGDYYAFACGQFNQNDKYAQIVKCACVTSIDSFGASTIIPNSAFYTMMDEPCSFATVEIPDTITKIGVLAFYGIALDPAIIGKGVESIGHLAFNGVKTVRMRGTTPPQLLLTESTDPYNHFGIGDTLALEKIYVPKGCGNTYKTATGWSTYADYIVEES